MSWSTELWDGFSVSLDRAKEGSKFASELEDFIRSLSALERDFAKKLMNLTKTKSTEIGSLNNAWMAVMKETEAIAKSHQEFGDKLSLDVDQSLKPFFVDNAKAQKKLGKAGGKLLSELESARKTVESSKKSYEASRRKKDELNNNKSTMQSSDPAYAKITKAVEKEGKSCEKLDEAYQKSISKIGELENKFYDTEMPMILAKLEQLELERIGVCRRAMSELVSTANVLPGVMSAACSAMNQAISAVDAKADNAEFCASKRSGSAKPPRVEYEPYDTAVGACRRRDGPGAGMRASVAVSPAPGLSVSAAAVSIPNPSSSPSPNPSAGPVLVKQTSQSSVSGAPSRPAAPKAGAGGGPVIYSRKAEQAEQARSVQPPSGSKENGSGSSAPEFYCRAKFAYTADDEQEISFAASEVIAVLFADESGWWEGTNEAGKTGVLPSNYVERLSDAEAKAYLAGKGNKEKEKAASPPKKPGSASAPPAQAPAAVNLDEFDKCQALYAYKAEDDSEHSLQPGDILTIEEEDDAGWWYGRKVAEPGLGVRRYASNFCKVFE